MNKRLLRDLQDLLAHGFSLNQKMNTDKNREKLKVKCEMADGKRELPVSSGQTTSPQPLGNELVCYG